MDAQKVNPHWTQIPAYFSIELSQFRIELSKIWKVVCESFH